MANTAGTIESWQRYDITVSRYGGSAGGGYVPNNNFSQDDECVALWRFEADGLLLDSQDDNDWVKHFEQADDPTADTSDYIEGASSLRLYEQAGVTQYPNTLKILDENLSLNFPYNGEPDNDTFTFSCWIKRKVTWTPGYEHWQGDDVLFAKVASAYPGVDLKLRIVWGNDGEPYDYHYGILRFFLQTSETGPAGETYDFPTHLEPNKWYHIAVTYTPGQYRIRVWDDTAQALLDDDLTGSCGTCNNSGEYYFYIVSGILGWENEPPQSSTNIEVETLFDEMVVFDRVLSINEIDQIRQGIYGT